jgi:acetoin utilization protein AcuB
MTQQGGLLVGQVMTSQPTCIRAETRVMELIRLFHAEQFRHLVVVDEERSLVGVLSDRDVLRCLGPEKSPDPSVLDGIRAGDLMSTDLITVTPGTTLEQAVGLMIQHGINCLPVQVDSTLVSILTGTDLDIVLQALLQTVRWSLSAEPVESSLADPEG